MSQEENNDIDYSLELHKLIEDKKIYKYPLVNEYGWVSDTEFFIWVPHNWFNEFVNELRRIFGDSIFDEGGFNVRIVHDNICMNLCDISESYFDIEEVFPKDKYQH